MCFSRLGFADIQNSKYLKMSGVSIFRYFRLDLHLPVTTV
jgi:hypothetical protein